MMYWTVLKQQGTYDGKFYAFGYSESNVGVYYNKKMFKEAGIDEASLPTLENHGLGLSLMPLLRN